MEARVMILGERGVGKSTIANELFELTSEGGGQFPEADSAGKALGSQLFRGQTGAMKGAQVVEVPGFLGEGVTSTRNIWAYIVNSMESLQKKVDVFILILNMEHRKENKQIVQAFVNYFGDNGSLNAMVLFTNQKYQDPEVAERYAMFHNHEFLHQLLKHKYKYQILPKFSTGRKEKIPRDEIIRQIQVLSQLPVYDSEMFKRALREDLLRWAREMKNRNERIRITKTLFTPPRYEIAGVPDTITQSKRFFDKDEIPRVITEMKGICTTDVTVMKIR